MELNYIKEYELLIADIKYKLSKLYLNSDIAKKYQQALYQITNKINEKSTVFEYHEAFLSALKIENELTMIINNHQDLILPPYENETYLNNKIISYNKKVNERKFKNKLLSTKLITYLLTGSLFLTMGMYTIDRLKNPTKDKKYFTVTTTYSTVNDEAKYTSSYEDINHIHGVIIKKITPWVIGENEAMRKEYTYHIRNLSLNDILNTRDYETILANLDYEEKTDTMQLPTYQGTYKYNEPIYEVTEISQNYDHYIYEKRNISKEIIALILSELMVYMTLIDLNEGPITESIMKTANEINDNLRIMNCEKSTAKLLNTQSKQYKKKTLQK